MVKKNILQSVLYWLIALSLLTPLIAFQHVLLEPMVFKMIAFFIVTELMILVYLILLIQGRADLPKNNWINWSLIIFLVVLGIVTVTSTDPFISFWGSVNRLMGYVTWLHLVAYSLVVSATVTSKDDSLRLLRVIILASLFVEIYGVGQYFGWSAIVDSQGQRIDSVMTNPLFLASYLLIVIPITLFHTLLTKLSFWRWLGVAAILLQGWLISVTASRGAFVALAFAGVTILIMLSLIRKSYKFWLASILTVVLLVSLYITVCSYRESAWVKQSTVLRRISEINLTHASAQVRVTAWQQGIEAWRQKPFLGWGLENQLSANNATYKAHTEKYGIKETLFDRFHNLVVDWLVTTGLVGLLAYLILLMSVLWATVQYLYRARTRWKRMVGLTCLSVVVAYTIFNMFAFDVITGVIYFMLVISLISSQIGGSEWKIRREWLFPLILLVVVAMYSVSLRPVLAGQIMSKAIAQYYQGQPEAAFTNAKSAFGYNTFLNSYMKDKFLSVSLEIFELINDPNQRDSIKLYFETSVTWVENIKENDPYAVYYYSNALNFYSRWVAWDETLLAEGESLLAHLEEISPTRPNTQMLAGQMYLSLNLDNLAIERFNKAIELSSDWGNPYYALAIVYAKQGNLNQMDANLELARSNGFVLYHPMQVKTLLTAMRRSLPARTVDEYQSKVINEATDYLLNLVDIRLETGDRDGAYRYLLDVLELDSGNAKAHNHMLELSRYHAEYVIPSLS